MERYGRESGSGYDHEERYDFTEPIIRRIGRGVLTTDRHHVIHTRNDWNIYPEGRHIRESILVTMEKTDHVDLHHECSPVPSLSYHVLKRTAGLYVPDQTSPLRSMEALMGAIEEAAKHPRAHEIERQRANLAVWAIDLQRPFIADALHRRNGR